MIRVATIHPAPLCAETPVPTFDNAEDRTKFVWRNADAVCFDVDSTVCQDEAIDELAVHLGVGEAVSNATKAAMNGNARFRDALALRLKIMNPSLKATEEFIKANPPKLTPGIRELVKTLHSRNVDVYLVSGGFRKIIEPVAEELDIPIENIYANTITFDEEGNYSGFDTNELTSDSGSKDVGKPAVLGLLKKKFQYQNIVMVGDGSTDLEACPPADAFIGFGGNQVRESVRSRADWFVMDFESLRKELSN